ncbi:MAG: hypothetical protein WA001_04730 [Patescibacteria group bacterium]
MNAPDLLEISQELRRVNLDALTIQMALTRLDKDGWLQEKTARCRTCGQREVYLITCWMEIPLHTKLSIDGQERRGLFEIVDGFCHACDADNLYPWLCKHDASRDRSLIGVRAERRKDGLCEECLESAVFGIWRNGTCTAGSCRSCNRVTLPGGLDQRRLKRFASFMAIQKMVNDRKHALEGLKLQEALKALRKVRAG